MSKTMIVGLTGACGAGKDTVATILCEIDHRYKRYSFADALKEYCAQNGPYQKEELGWNGKDWSGPKTFAGRQYLQDVAKEKRDKDPNIWLNITKNKIEADKPERALITDVRHKNEIRYVQDNYRRGLVLIVNPKAEEAFYQLYKEKGPDVCRESEMEWRLHIISRAYFDGYPQMILNNGTMEELRENVIDFNYYVNIDSVLAETSNA